MSAYSSSDTTFDSTDADSDHGHPRQASSSRSRPPNLNLVNIDLDDEPLSPFSIGGDTLVSPPDSPRNYSHPYLYQKQSIADLASQYGQPGAMSRANSNTSLISHSGLLTPTAQPQSSYFNPSLFSSESFNGKRASFSAPRTFQRGQSSRGPTPKSSMYSLNDQSSILSSPTVKTAVNYRKRKTAALFDEIEKPWLVKPVPLFVVSKWLTVLFIFLFGIVGSFLRILLGTYNVELLKGNLCLVMEDNFDSPTLNTAIWSHDQQLGGFGTGVFEMTTNSSNNTFIEDGILYMVPTLTSDSIGTAAIFSNYTYNITGCTTTNVTACGAVSNTTAKSVINPVMSSRISTINSTSITYGKIEIRAKLPKGDWLWPALWMLPVENTYGDWPLSGEIDIMEATGNNNSYSSGNNHVFGQIQWGPLQSLKEITYGFWTRRRGTYSDNFHTYALEWSDKFIRTYVDSRLHYTLNLKFNEPFFTRGQFPSSTTNNSNIVSVTNPWGTDSFSAPFDQAFYLIMDVSVGGTNGWFPDNKGGKMWYDGSSTAMYNFAKAQRSWYSTWATDPKDRGMAIDYVRMYQLC